MTSRIFALLTLSVLAHLALAQGSVIVQMQPGHDAIELEALFPVNLVDETPNAPFALFETLNGADPHVVEAQMRLRPDLIVFAEDDARIEAPENIGAGKGGTIAAVYDPHSVYRENARMFEQISFRPMLAGFTGRTIKVAVLDTGVPLMNLTLRSRVVGGVAIAPDRGDYFDLPTGADTNGNGAPNEGLGHGSMVTGVIAQMAPNARYLVARVADADGVSRAWYLIKGLAYACVNGAEVVNISMGSVGGIVAMSDVIENWVVPQGVLVVAAAGNNGSDKLTSPAEISSVISVAGVDENDVKAEFSNWHSKVKQSAPATGIKSAWWDNTIGVWSGTSFASPMVAAVVADTLQFRARFTGVQMDLLKDVIKNTGDNIDGKNALYSGELGLRLNCRKMRMALLRF